MLQGKLASHKAVFGVLKVCLLGTIKLIENYQNSTPFFHRIFEAFRALFNVSTYVFSPDICSVIILPKRFFNTCKPFCWRNMFPQNFIDSGCNWHISFYLLIDGINTFTGVIAFGHHIQL
jgi:hypothetical protein